MLCWALPDQLFDVVVRLVVFVHVVTEVGSGCFLVRAIRSRNRSGELERQQHEQEQEHQEVAFHQFF
jgi:hypothetical protein